MSFRRDDENLLKKFKPIWIKMHDLKDIELNALPVYDNRYIETKISTYGDNVYFNFPGLNMSEDDTECEYFIVTSIGFYMFTKTNIIGKYI